MPPFLRGFLSKLVLAVCLGAGGAAMAMYRDVPVIKTEVVTLQQNVQKLNDKDISLDKKDDAIEEDLKALYEMRGEVKGLTEEMRQFHEDVRALRSQLPPTRR